MITDKEVSLQQKLIKERDELNKKISLLEFKKDNYVLGDLQKILDSNEDKLDKKLNVAIVTQKEYNYATGIHRDNIYDDIRTEELNLHSLKTHLGDGNMVVLTRILNIVMEPNTTKESITMWIILKD